MELLLKLFKLSITFIFLLYGSVPKIYGSKILFSFIDGNPVLDQFLQN